MESSPDGNANERNGAGETQPMKRPSLNVIAAGLGQGGPATLPTPTAQGRPGRTEAECADEQNEAERQKRHDETTPGTGLRLPESSAGPWNRAMRLAFSDRWKEFCSC